jgi:hypothetical protein
MYGVNRDDPRVENYLPNRKQQYIVIQILMLAQKFSQVFVNK